MQIESLTIRTKRMIDNLKTICANFGLGGSPGEYKIITQVFLYKYLNDKFFYQVRKVEPTLAKAENLEAALEAMPDDQYEMLLAMLGGDTARLKKTHYISYLFNHQNDDSMKKPDGTLYPFHELFDDTLVDISNYNLDVFSVQTGGEEKIKLFDPISQYVIEGAKKTPFCRAIINKLVEFRFSEVYDQNYDFFAQIFEYLIKDYNKDFGKYAEYYTPHIIATIIARILVQEKVQNVTVYDPAAGSGTLVLALAHQIGEDNCTIYTQDISSKSNEFLRLNLILNNLVHSLGNVVHDDTLVSPRHLNAKGNGLAKFDYIVSNPPFNMDFSDNRDTLAGEAYKERFFAGVPSIPPKKKSSMDIYLMFLQHIIYSMEEHGKAAVVVPTGFLTASKRSNAIAYTVHEYLVNKKWLRGVISMPPNIFANTGTNVSILFLDKDNQEGKVVLMDASKLGTKEKVDGKNQKTVLSEEEITKIIDTFNAGEPVDDFCVAVTYEEIKQKKLSFSAGQYFEVKIEYVDLTPEEFAEKMHGFTIRLDELFSESHRLEEEIKQQLGRVKYE